jgi:TDG/mug DNA glycosylase family protein
MNIYSFPPISNTSAKVLILGTMPGALSLKTWQYYAHGGNHFWPVLFELFNQPFTKDYEVRKQLALSNGIAIWDVLKVCQRESSADSDIMKEEPNNFESFFQSHPDLRCIFFNGKNAEAYFNKYKIQTSLPTQSLPSTSSGNGWHTKANKLTEFERILQFLDLSKT